LIDSTGGSHIKTSWSSTLCEHDISLLHNHLVSFVTDTGSDTATDGYYHKHHYHVDVCKATSPVLLTAQTQQYTMLLFYRIQIQCLDYGVIIKMPKQMAK